jgi:hypothetical protein
MSTTTKTTKSRRLTKKAETLKNLTSQAGAKIDQERDSWLCLSTTRGDAR